MSVNGLAAAGTPAERAARIALGREFRARVAAIYESPDGAAGCCCHLILDDGNYGDSALELVRHIAARARHANCAWVVETLAALPVAKRRRLVRP